MRSLICAFVVGIWHKQVFSWSGSNDVHMKSHLLYIFRCDFRIKQSINQRMIHVMWLNWMINLTEVIQVKNIHWGALQEYLGPVKRICVFEHTVMTNFNCACPAIQRGQGSGFLSEGSSWLTACMRESEGSGETARMPRLAVHIGDKYQIRLTRSFKR